MSLNAFDLTVGTPDMPCTVTAPDGSTITPPKTQTTFNDGKACSSSAGKASNDVIERRQPSSPQLQDAVDRFGPDWDDDGRRAIHAKGTMEKAGNAALEGFSWALPGSEVIDPLKAAGSAVKAAAPLVKAAAAHMGPAVQAAADGARHAASTLFQRSDPAALGGAFVRKPAGDVGKVVEKSALGPANLQKLGLRAEKPGTRGEQTFVATGKAAAQGGKLTVPTGVTLTPAEAKCAAYLVRGGDNVVSVPRSAVGRTPDLKVNGKPTELKTMSDVRPNKARTALTDTIRVATRQGKNVIIDARDQAGLTRGTARSAMQKAVDGLSNSRVNGVRVILRENGEDYEISSVKQQ